MPITFHSFVAVCEPELIRLLKRNNNQITNRLIDEFYTYIMGGFYTKPSENQREVIQKYALTLKEEIERDNANQ